MKKNNPQKKILLISPFAGPLVYGGCEGGAGGAERQMVLIANKMSEYPFQIYLCCQEFPSTQPQDNPAIKVVNNPFRYLGGGKLYWLVDGFKLFFQIVRIKPDWVIMRNGGPGVIFWILFSRSIFPLKYIYWVQSDRDIEPVGSIKTKTDLSYRMLNYVISRADHIICQHKTQYQTIRKWLKIPVDIIPNFSANLWNPDTDEKNQAFDVFWPGNDSDNKRYQIVLDLAKLLPELNFVVAMNVSDETRFREYSEASLKISNIRYLGTLLPHACENLYYHAKLVLNSSINEGFPNTFLQAWKQGIPVITAGVDPSGIITTYKLGDVVQVERQNSQSQIQTLPNSITIILNDRDLYQKYSANAKKYILENHNDVTSGAILSNILNDI
jgi:hypothetical protein